MKNLFVVMVMVMVMVLATGGWAQQAFRESIQDNSFLIEEAYNQDRGVVQHISNLTYSHPAKTWLYVLTQEWPVFSHTHQFSYSIPYAWLHANSQNGLGDIALNYRLQLVDGANGYSLAPRLSVILPTGNEKKNLGSGNTAYQISLPVSKRLHDQWAVHLNLGATLMPGVRNGAKKETLKTYNLGASVIYMLKEYLNFFVESTAVFADAINAAGHVKNSGTYIINPGFCFAKNYGSLQIVPGLAFPIQLNGSPSSRQLFIYLSFEHPFSKN